MQEASVIEGNDPVTGHIISTTIGGKNGEPKQVSRYDSGSVQGTEMSPVDYALTLKGFFLIFLIL